MDSSNVSSRSQSLILKPGETVTTNSERWSLKGNQLFSNQLATISQQEAELIKETEREKERQQQQPAPRSEIEFVSAREAIVYLGEMKFSLKLVDVEYSEAYLGGNGEFSCQGGVHGRFMLTSAGQEPSIGRYPVQQPTKKRSIDLAILPPSAPFDPTHSRPNTRRAASPPSSGPPVTSSSSAAAAAAAAYNKPQEEVGIAGVRLDDLPLQTSAHDITAFFSGLKIRSTFFSYFLSPATSEWKCLVYVCFESTTGASLAIQRSGERLRNKSLPVSVAPVDAWEMYCAQCRGVEGGLASAEWIKLPEAMLLAASPHEVAEFWFRHLSPPFSSRTHIFNDLRGAYARSLLDEELRMAWDKQDLDDQTDDGTVIERSGAISRDALLEALRKRMYCLWIAVTAREGAGSIMATFQRAASLDEHFFSVLWRLQLQSRVSSMLAIDN